MLLMCEEADMWECHVTGIIEHTEFSLYQTVNRDSTDTYI